MTIHCLIENSCSTPDLTAEHGLSLLIDTGGLRILFDTGASPAFADNASRLGIDLDTVDFAILSHGHYDHGGGIPRFLELNSHAPVWVSPHAFAPHFNAAGKDIGLPPALANHPRILPVHDAVDHLAPGISLHSAATLPQSFPAEGAGMTAVVNQARVPEDFRHEQYLLVREAGRSILISGCSHRGILNIATHFDADILIGGFHLMRVDPVTEAARLHDIADRLLATRTRYFTGHCTGDAAYRVLKSRMGDRLQTFSTGQVIRL